VNERTGEAVNEPVNEPVNERSEAANERTDLKHTPLFLYNNLIRNDNRNHYGWVGKPTIPDFHDHRCRITKQ
jgi:hypothetical protein